VTINLVGLQPGVTVRITETVDAAGQVTITITLPPPSVTSQTQTMSGEITDVGDDAFGLQTPDGSSLRLHMAPDALANLGLSSCDVATVTYHQDAGILIADDVQLTGNSSTGDCAPVNDATGTITSVSGSGLTVNTDSGPQSFTTDSSDTTAGFQVGDVVDVTYDGNQVASDVEYVEEDASGTVSSVSSSSLTITDDASGQTDTFLPGQTMDVQTGVFDGIQTGDGVDVSYHVSAGKLVADTADDVLQISAVSPTLL
jgi:hypothetical protein